MGLSLGKPHLFVLGICTLTNLSVGDVIYDPHIHLIHSMPIRSILSLYYYILLTIS